MHSEKPFKLRNVSRVRRSMFLGDKPGLELCALANVRRVFGSRAHILYEAEIGEGKITLGRRAARPQHPGDILRVRFERRDRCRRGGGGLLRYEGSGLSAPCGDRLQRGIFWNINANGYLVVSNVSDSQGSFFAQPGRAYLWDCQDQCILHLKDRGIKLDPHSCRVQRRGGGASSWM